MQESPLKDLLKKGIQKSLEEQQVPLHLHLKVVDALSKSMIAHKADLNLIHVMANRHATQLNEHDAMTKQEREAHQAQLAQYDEQIRRLTMIDHLKGEPGYTPQKGIDFDDGETPAIQDIVEAIKPYIPSPLKGEKGKDAQFDKEAFLKEVVDYIRKEKPLDISHIKNAQTFMMNGIKYKMEEMMHGGGPSTSGGGFTVLPATGAINSSNVTYTFTKVPSYIVADGVWFPPISANGTVFWTNVGTTVTMINPPTFDLYGIL